MPRSRTTPPASVVTRFGTLQYIDHCTNHPDGTPAAVVVTGPNRLTTPQGTFVPLHTTDDLRCPRLEAIYFHPEGTLKSLSLEEGATVHTVAGPVPVEHLTFYPSGAPKRLFPLNGKLSGYWSQEDEFGLAKPVALALPHVRESESIFISLLLYEGGAPRSLTLWPNMRITVNTPAGEMAVRTGVAWYEDGAVRSVEPAEPAPVTTPVGTLTAFNPDPEGIVGDANSLGFAPDGRVAEVMTVTDTLVVTCGGVRERFAPGERVNLCDERERDPSPLILTFTYDAEGHARVTIRHVLLHSDGESGGQLGEARSFDVGACTFTVEQPIFGIGQMQAMHYPCGS